jgi:ATP-dependent 26S proteasome regulatory subunit
MRRVYGYINDDTSARDASVALAAALWDWPPGLHLDGRSALARWRLAWPNDTGPDTWSVTAGWRADPLVLAELTADDPVAGTGLGGKDIEPVGESVLYPSQLDEIIAFAAPLYGRPGEQPGIEIELAGPPGAGKTVLAAQAGQKLGLRLVSADAATLVTEHDPVGAAVRQARQAMLHDCVLVWQHADQMPAAVAAAIDGLSACTFLETGASTAAPAPVRGLRLRCSLPPLDRSARLRLWSVISDLSAPSPVLDWALLPREVVTAARALPAGDPAVRAVLRRTILAPIPDLLTPVHLPYSWDDLVLAPHVAEHVRELEEQARLRGDVLDHWGFADLTAMGRGLTALFAGPSGCGKTMAAQVLARSLGLELYRADLAGVVNKYIGETEKHLRLIFEACQRAPVLLLFDEADALFGKRTQVRDAHDRFANIEIDYLLQCMERFDGLAVLATNRKADLDAAFLRRLRFVIDFVPPGTAERERLWRGALQNRTDADGVPLVEELDWASIAAELDMSGADIKSAATAAAFLARSQGTQIGMAHVLAAARRELEKRHIVVRPGQLGVR